MKELSIKRLKDISDNWIKGKTLYSEEDIFSLLDMEYVNPENRNI